ncbi:MAG TPA: large conductance mechanosensitive channel protein MscL [Chloroflexia bacterium]|nr:large conductance mechanosensitive channel protein MscL [Chloroflexia bacterium]
MWKEFRTFISKGNVIELAVALIMAAAFGAVVKGLIDWIIMPPIGKALGGVDFSSLYINLSGTDYPSAVEAQAAGASGIYYGQFLNTVITFLVLAFVMFLLVKAYNSTKPDKATTTKECPFCLSTIPIGASRCPSCTSELQVAT